MAWLGAPVPVTSSDVRRLLRTLANDFGYVVPCRCGAARFCAGIGAVEDEVAFRTLHAAHMEGK